MKVQGIDIKRRLSIFYSTSAQKCFVRPSLTISITENHFTLEYPIQKRIGSNMDMIWK
jgi:hypothetical protein